MMHPCLPADPLNALRCPAADYAMAQRKLTSISAGELHVHAQKRTGYPLPHRAEKISAKDESCEDLHALFDACSIL